MIASDNLNGSEGDAQLVAGCMSICMEAMVILLDNLVDTLGAQGTKSENLQDFVVQLRAIRLNFPSHLPTIESTTDAGESWEFMLPEPLIQSQQSFELDSGVTLDTAKDRTLNALITWLPYNDQNEVKESLNLARCPGTGDWLLQHNLYQEWKCKDLKVILLMGMRKH